MNTFTYLELHNLLSQTHESREWIFYSSPEFIDAFNEAIEEESKKQINDISINTNVQKASSSRRSNRILSKARSVFSLRKRNGHH